MNSTGTALCLLLLVACGSGSNARDAGTPPADAGTDAAADAAVDGGAVWACACEEGETCGACYRHIGQCCYDDETIFGQVDRLAANCERSGVCAACCSECLEKSCDELHAGNVCPADAPE
jgi:hypothetical protein